MQSLHPSAFGNAVNSNGVFLSQPVCQVALQGSCELASCAATTPGQAPYLECASFPGSDQPEAVNGHLQRLGSLLLQRIQQGACKRMVIMA